MRHGASAKDTGLTSGEEATGDNCSAFGHDAREHPGDGRVQAEGLLEAGLQGRARSRTESIAVR